MRIAILLPIGYEYSLRFQTGIHRFVDEHPLLTLVDWPYRDRSGDAIDEAGLAGCDGAIVWADRANPWVYRLVDAGLRVVSCNRDWLGTPGVVSVAADLDAVCRLAIAHLSAGRPRVLAVVFGDLANRPHAVEMCRQMSAAAASVGLGTSILIDDPAVDFRRQRLGNVAAERELLAFLGGLPLPAAVYCENDYIARLVCSAAELLGLDVPGQLSVLGAGDFRIATADRPAISTTPRRIESIGHAAARVLFDWISTGGPQPADVLLPPEPIIVRQSTAGPDAADDDIAEAARIIDAEACAGLTVEALCDRVGLSKVTVSARFAARFATTPGARIRQVRVDRAKRLLAESRLSVADVATATGFDDQSKFGKFFKRETGLTPTAFRDGPDARGDGGERHGARS
jgi:LacI family transcriptional regulator